VRTPPGRAGSGNAPRVSPARVGHCPVDRQLREGQRPAPDPAGAKRPPWAGRAQAGGFGPPAGPDPGAALWQGRWPLPLKRIRCRRPSGRVQETQRVSPARAGPCPADRSVRETQRPAPDPAGAKRPPGAGRALAGGFGPRLVLVTADRCGKGDGLCQCNGESAFATPGGIRKRDPRFPRPRGTVPCRPAGPGTTEGQRPTRRGRSARRGRVGRWPGALGPRLAWSRRSAVAKAMAFASTTVKVLSPLRAGSGNATRVSPARARRCPVDRQVREQQNASARPGGREAPAMGGSGAGRGLWPPAGPEAGVAPWQGRWPLPDRTGSLEEFCLPAKSPCGWHVCIGLPDGNRPARLRFPAVGIAGAEQRARRAVRVDGPWRQCQGRMRALSGTPAGPGCTGRAHGARRRAEGRGSRIACPVRGHPRGWRGRKRPSRRVTPC